MSQSRDEQNPESVSSESEEPEVVAHEQEQEEDSAGCIVNNSNAL